MSIADIIRPQVAAHAPYRPSAIPPNMTCLNANESAEPTNSEALNRYPENRPIQLGTQLAALYQVPVDNLLVTRGSSDAIDLLVRACCIEGRDNIVTTTPTFDMYAKYAQLQGADVRYVPLNPDNNFALETDEVISICDTRTKLVFLGSPNNPTGSLVSVSDIRTLLRARANQSIIVVDEAYLEFSEQSSATSLLSEFDNLVVLRTLSKAFATAGARCGCAIAARVVIEALDKLLPPYALPTPVVDCVLRATSAASLAAATQAIAEVRAHRAALTSALKKYSFVETVWPSEANFLLVRFANAADVHAHLYADNLLVRNFASDTTLEDCLRITIGTGEQQWQLLASLDRYKDVRHDA
ncbi:MAG: histidinol-phosphate transaminase [Pseudomonadota bacterium]